MKPPGRQLGSYFPGWPAAWRLGQLRRRFGARSFAVTLPGAGQAPRRGPEGLIVHRGPEDQEDDTMVCIYLYVYREDNIIVYVEGGCRL